MTKKLAMISIAVMTTLLALVVLWQFRIVVVFLLISLALAAALSPLVTQLTGRKIIIKVAWILLYLVAFGGFGFLLFLVGRSAIVEIQQLAQSVSVQNAWKLPVWLEGSLFQQTLVTQLPPPGKLFEAFTGGQGQLILPALLSFFQGIGGFVTGLILILFLSIYWSIHQIHFERLWLSLLAPAQRTQARSIWHTIEPDIGAYIRGQIIQSVGAGLLLGLGYWLIGSPYPALLALASAFACLIPMVGIVLVVIPVLLVGLLTSVQLGMFTTLYASVVLLALGIWVKPRLFNRRWDNPILTVVLLLAMADAFGLIGLIIAPPLSAVCQILWSHLVSHRAVSGAATQILDLKKRQARIWDTIKSMGEPPLPLLTSSMERLSRLIEKAEPILRAALPAEPSGSEVPNTLKSKPEKHRGRI
jgi:predicted PurR-regulated permease PerM